MKKVFVFYAFALIFSAASAQSPSFKSIADSISWRVNLVRGGIVEDPMYAAGFADGFWDTFPRKLPSWLSSRLFGIDIWNKIIAQGKCIYWFHLVRFWTSDSYQIQLSSLLYFWFEILLFVHCLYFRDVSLNCKCYSKNLVVIIVIIT